MCDCYYHKCAVEGCIRLIPMHIPWTSNRNRYKVWCTKHIRKADPEAVIYEWQGKGRYIEKVVDGASDEGMSPDDYIWKGHDIHLCGGKFMSQNIDISKGWRCAILSPVGRKGTPNISNGIVQVKKGNFSIKRRLLK